MCECTLAHFGQCVEMNLHLGVTQAWAFEAIAPGLLGTAPDMCCQIKK